MKYTKQTKKTGLSLLFVATTYSIGGARRLLLETAARHDLMVYVAVTLLFIITGTSMQNHLIFTVMSMVFWESKP
ncbi:hypothetical protein [Brucella tritici]|uniref:hypothetical protein n=1 Tax=Brucella tritici TaxID=94626 RepID=UPI0020017485|nr:hypothetical protein [Brucella tritici]